MMRGINQVLFNDFKLMKAPPNTIFVLAHNRLSIRAAFQCDPIVIKNEVHHALMIKESMK